MEPKTEDITYQRRSVDLVEIRVDAEGAAPKIQGYASVFNAPYEINSFFGSFVEEIAPGAFTKTLKEADVRALMNHNPDYVLGRNKAGTLRLKEDAKGLAVEIDPPDTQWAKDLMASMKRGDINQMSFGFIPVQGKSDWTYGKENEPDKVVRREVKLLDVSVVAYPASPTTEAYVRSSIEALQRFLPTQAPEPTFSHSDDTHREPLAPEHSLPDDGSRETALPATEPEVTPEPPTPRHSLAYYKALLATLETP